MEETVTGLQGQLAERQSRDEAEQRQGEAKLRVQPRTLLGLLDHCSNSLS